MKKIYILIILAFSSQVILLSQDCLPEGIVFTTQEQIDNFQTNYPSCTEIGGSLEIKGDDITNLNGINVITLINGDLIIGYNDLLTSLTGLANLTSVKGQIEIRTNSVLTSLTGIDNINPDSVTGLYIFLNPMLSVCSFEFVCNLIEAASPNFYYVNIFGNAGSCFDIFTLSESCGNLVYFTSQAEIDSFQINYPGISTVDKNILINGIDITNLDSLNVITTINGNMRIGGNDSLTNLVGLNSLKSVNNGIWIESNKSLINFSGLDSLSNIGGDFRVANNESLTSIEGLESLLTVNGELMIYNNESLLNLTGLSNLTYIGENLIIAHNSTVEDLFGLESLEAVGGFLSIGENDNLTSLFGLDSLNTIGENLYIVNNNALTSLSGLESLHTINGRLSIYNNSALTSLSGIDNIEASTISDLDISGNVLLSTCEVQSVCDFMISLHGSVNIYGNATGCNDPIEVANACGTTLPCLPFGNYYFTTQSNIDSFINDYPNCNELEGNVMIQGDDITNLEGLYDLTSINGVLTITDNDVLTNLIGLENLTSIEKGLTIGGLYGTGTNPVLASLTGLDNISSIKGYIHIANNNSLVSLSEFSNVTSTLSELFIEGNNSLTSLEGLDNFIAESTCFLSITNNSLLSTCEIKSICDYLIDPNGNVYIHDNAIGCNSSEEIVEACDASGIPDIILQPIISIYPNPAKREITISSKDELKIEQVVIYNQVGQNVLQVNQIINSIDISRLKQGIYIVEVKTKESKIRKKLIIR